MKEKMILACILITSLCACNENSRVKRALDVAGENREELLKVIEHYKKMDNKDPLKLEAALFLIENMPKQHSIGSEAVRAYQTKIRQSGMSLRMDTLNAWWETLSMNHVPKIEYDIHTLKANFLINDINKAFEVWRSSPWTNEVDFNLFCQHILPYRFQNELLADAWRDSLYNEYHPYIAGIQDMGEAFAIIHRKVSKQVGSGSSSFPYIINALAMRHQAKATCIQQCVLLGSVLRALGIPVAIDDVGRWANYSTNAHAWVSLVAKEGTYTVYEEDTVAKRNNAVDSSIFKQDYQAEENYPLNTDFQKRYAKIRRSTYEHNAIPQELDVKWSATSLLSNPFKKDVSSEYNLTNNIEVEVATSANHAYLCTFATGRDWEPISYSEKKSGKCSFPNMGDSVAYLPVIYIEEKATPTSNPFLMLNGRKVCLEPNLSVTQRMVLSRKYPLTRYWVNVWAPMIGGCFEGSNDSGFKQKEILHTITSTPVFRNEIVLDKVKSYRYVRYTSPEKAKTSMTELECWSGDQLLKGKPFGIGADGVEKLFDGDTFTILKRQNNGYAFGIDFGTAMPVTRLVYYPRNDGNFVVPDHDYELFYYDMQWKSLGKRKNTGFELAYDNVPTDALFLLKDLTEGKEERIFTYENGKQVWW